MTTPLHPNLARLAASYDEIFERWTQGRMDAAQARNEISSLVARDDEGVLWSIDPDSGSWLRRTRTGELIPDTPPTYGYATPTAHDLSPAGGFNPDSRISFHKVDDGLLHAPSSLAGSTRRQGRITVKEHNPEHTRWVRIGVGIAALLALLLAVLVFRSNTEDQIAPEAPAPTAPATTNPANLTDG